MKKISQKEIDYILDNIDIVDLVSEYVNLEKRGHNYKGLCPFHNEKTPSFTVSPDKKIAHCFGCGNGGNIFQFLSKIENITYNQAIVKLGNRLGLDLEDTYNKKDVYDLSNEIDLMFYANELIADYYNYILLNTKEAEPALEYLLNRGITKETIKNFKLGYAPDGSVAINFFNSKSISLDIIKRAGIIGQSEDSLNYYDIFKNRIMFPIKDLKNRIVAFSGRTMSNDKSIAKYYNTHETEIFEKRYTLYNYYDARQHILKEKQVIICEGYMDVISSHQAGVKNIVALMGTNLDSKCIGEILKLTNNIVLSLDNDSSGIKSMLEIGNDLIYQTNKLYNLVYYNSKDLDEFISKNNNSSADFNFYDYVSKNKKHFLEFKIDYLLDLSGNDIESKIKYKNEILNNISTLEDDSLKDIIVSYLSSKFNIEKNILYRELSNYKNNRININTGYEPRYDLPKFYNRVNYDKKICALFKYFLYDRNIFLEYYEELDSFNFEDSLFSRLFDTLVVYYNSYNNFEFNKFLNNINDIELLNLVNYITDSNKLIIDVNNKEIVKYYVDYLKKSSILKKDVIEIKENLKAAIAEASYDKQIEILRKLTKFKK
ncbi:DNA primase [Gemelliphila palaticanis]|uniref:DNA primase n=1 Tax=Gemelliphila palaticanis TaxID=81950 RepID=A0ABX2T009_9BACL|nr:DNA primase [Gemella palaticanis]MBF0715758.1 DNA primase [Gemella palaticanis]NYS47688.1 DNA primase [Gemella palaticanis]